MNKIILDWNKYLDTAREAVSEGMVLLENNGVLPLREGCTVSLFGRMQEHYYKSGTGSGGMVNVSKVWGIPEGLTECGIKLNEKLRGVYSAWSAENPVDLGVGWGGEPWSQKEMPVSDELAAGAAANSDCAICIIARTAGEEQDQSDEGGSYRLTETELEMLKTVRRHFKEMTVLLNVGGIIDMSFVPEVKPDAVMYIWQGGMTGGLGTADVLTGKVSPSGKLPDTIAYNISDYPSAPYFGNTERNFYCEDIYVGYRYFETFAKDKVMYPFGYGLSYTKFSMAADRISTDGSSVSFDVVVRNIGGRPGKEVVQIYFEAPQGRLGKPLRALCAYQKTDVLVPEGFAKLHFDISKADMASFDDSGVTGFKDSFVLEAGEYSVYAGSDVRSAEKICTFNIENTYATEKLSEACAPVLPFERMRPEKDKNGFKPAFEPVPLMETDMDKRRAADLPADIPQTGDKGIKLADVKSGKHTMDEFIAQLSDDDLSCIIRGEGMGSPRVTAGTAAAFGGVSDSLSGYGIPCGCCDDGPSGMRLDCGTKAFSLPNGTLLASSFNAEIQQRLFAIAGIEIAANNVECLLGPGMNIHRHPLNGRNFEYFSEDPYLTGTCAAAQLKGLHSSGVTGTIKHFCGNNQETGRHVIDSAISKRALREIYLRGFEIAVKQGNARSVMTTYGSLNGLWTAGNYDLVTTVLRKEWGFEGFVMTDWWANINERGKAPDKSDFAQIARAQNDTYMVCADAAHNTTGDNTLASLAAGTLTRGELQRNAANICRFLINTHAMSRLLGTMPEISIINCPDDNGTAEGENVVFYELNRSLTIQLNGVLSDRGSNFVFALDVQEMGMYNVIMTASSTASETAQIPVTFFTTGFPAGVFTFNGTNGKPVEIMHEARLYSRFVTCRLYFGQSGLKPENIRFEYAHDIPAGQP